jgi:hypothetical protein
MPHFLYVLSIVSKNVNLKVGRIYGLAFARPFGRLELRNLSAIAHKKKFRETFGVPGGEDNVSMRS